MVNLLAQGGFGCIYYPALSKKTGRWTQRDFVTKIQRNDESAENEVLIGEKIRNSPRYKLFFLPVLKSWPLSIKANKKKRFEGCDAITTKHTNYLAMNIAYLDGCDLIQSLKSVSNRRRVLLLMETFRYLLFGLEALAHINIVHLDLKFGNVLFASTSDEPRIADFGISIASPESLLIRKGNQEDALRELRTHFYVYTVEYPVWCLDIIVLALIAEKQRWGPEIAGLLVSDIDASHKLTAAMPPKIAHEWREQATSQLRKYSKMKTVDLVNYLLLQWRTWDTYSLAIMFFDTQSNIRNSDKSIFIEKWRVILEKNVSPDPEKRLVPSDTRKQFDDMFLTWGSPQVYEEVVQELGGGPRFQVGQRVRISKPGGQLGNEAVVLDPDWSSGVKVMVSTGSDTGDRKTYISSHLSSIE